MKPVKVEIGGLRDAIIVPRGDKYEVWHKGKRVGVHESYIAALAQSRTLPKGHYPGARQNPNASLGWYVGLDENFQLHVKRTAHPIREPWIQAYGPFESRAEALAHTQKLPKENPYKHERIRSAGALRRSGLTKYRSVVTPKGDVLRIAFPPGRRKTGSGKLQSILHKTNPVTFGVELGYRKRGTAPNPPRTKIYSRCIEIIASKAGMPHLCDAACKRYGHKYRHTFKGNACIYGLPDGSILIK